MEKQTTAMVETRGQSEEMISADSGEGVSPDNHLASPSNMAITPTKASMSLEEHGSGGDLCYKAIENGESETCMQAVNHNSGEVTFENVKLPFIKTSPFWEKFESMEVFRIMPQQPHFRPLQQLNEFFREGHAIGDMISFTDMVEKTRKAQLDEPNSVLEKILNALVSLEADGFTVQPIRVRLAEFLRLKNSEAQLDKVLNQVQGKIIKGKHEAEKLKSIVDETNEKLWELQESIILMNKKRQTIFMKKQTKGSSIVTLQRKLEETAEKIQGTELEFDHVAKAPM